METEPTIHSRTYLNVEVDSEGLVRGVWYRNLFLPYKINVVDEARVKELQEYNNVMHAHPTRITEINIDI